MILSTEKKINIVILLHNDDERVDRTNADGKPTYISNHKQRAPSGDAPPICCIPYRTPSCKPEGDQVGRDCASYMNLGLCSFARLG